MLLMADPGRYAEFLSRYADQAEATDAPLTERDRHVRKLLAGVRAGDRESAVAFHDLVAQDVWGGSELVDRMMSVGSVAGWVWMGVCMHGGVCRADDSSNSSRL